MNLRKEYEKETGKEATYFDEHKYCDAGAFECWSDEYVKWLESKLKSDLLNRVIEDDLLTLTNKGGSTVDFYKMKDCISVELNDNDIEVYLYNKEIKDLKVWLSSR